MTHDRNACLQSVNPKEVHWTGGFWGRLFNHCETDMLQSMEQALLDKNNAAYFGNFDAASGVKPDRHHGTYWSDGDCYKWIEAAAHVYAVTGDKRIDTLMDRYIDSIAAAQEPDGYICTQIQLVRQRNRWSNFEFHELYNFGHLFTAAAVHAQITGKENFLYIAKKAGDHLYGVFSSRPKELVHFGFNPSQIMGCVDLYRVTDDNRFLELALIFVEMRGSAAGGSDKHQARVPLLEEDEAVGHSVTANYLWAGATDILLNQDDAEIQAALERIWANITEKKLYVTGGVAPYYEGLSSRGDRVSESFAWDYQLPNRRAYNETCANIAFAMWNKRMLDLTGEAKYADTMELVMYNAGLSGGSYDGTSFYYANPLSRRHHALFKETAGPLGDNKAAFENTSEGERWKTHICYCCPPSYVRTVARINTWAYGKADKELRVHLYGDNEFRGDIPGIGQVQLKQTTNYPWEGTVSLEVVEGQGRWSLGLRIPGWCTEANVSVDGSAVQGVASGMYLMVERDWKGGEHVTLELDMPAVLMRCNPLVEENHGMACVKRGPVVYCLESPELPSTVSIDDLSLLSGAEITPRYDEDFLGGATLLDSQVLVTEGPAADGALYAPLGSLSSRRQAVTFIPYHLWANRGVTEMSIWLPLVPFVEVSNG